MPVSSSMQTKVIVSAEDRGLSKLMRRLSGETDATMAKFGQLGTTLAGLGATFSAGFGIKKALGWLDEMEKSVFSIATVLTDTKKGLSSNELSRVFDQNARHAQAMFNVFQKQARRSIADVQELINAYQIFANVGMAAPANDRTARFFDQIVTRVKLSTAGQNQQQQVFQELRAILQGRARATDVLGSRFAMVDKDYQNRIKQLVRTGDFGQVSDYLMSLMSNIPLDEKIQNLLSTQLKIVQGNVREWAMKAFSPLKDAIVDTLKSLNKSFEGGGNSFLSGLEKAVSAGTDMLVRFLDVLQRIAATDFGRWLAETAPQALALAGAFSAGATALGVMSSAAGALMTLPGLAIGGYAAYSALDYYNRRNGREFNGDWFSLNANGEYDWPNTLKGIQDKVEEIAAYLWDYKAYGEFVVRTLQSGAFTVAGGFMEMLSKAVELVGEGWVQWQDLVETLKQTPEWAKAAYEVAVAWLDKTWNWLAERLESAYVKIEDTVERALMNIGGAILDAVAKLTEWIVNAFNSGKSALPWGMGAKIPNIGMPRFFQEYRAFGGRRAINDFLDSAYGRQRAERRAGNNELAANAEERLARAMEKFNATVDFGRAAAEHRRALNYRNPLDFWSGWLGMAAGNLTARGEEYAALGLSAFNRGAADVAQRRAERAAGGPYRFTYSDPFGMLDKYMPGQPDMSNPYVKWVYENADTDRGKADKDTIPKAVMAGLDDYYAKLGDFYEQIRAMSADTAKYMQSTFSTLFLDTFTGNLKSAGDYFKMFCDSMLKSWSDMAAKMTMKSIMGGVGGLLGDASGSTGGASGGLMGWLGKLVGSADGNVLRGGFRAFADGGIATGPTLGLIGEGRYNEAVVPLPDGRRIPVDMQGGVVVNVVDNSGAGIGKTVNQSVDEEGRTVIDIILDAASRNRGGFRSKLRNSLQMG